MTDNNPKNKSKRATLEESLQIGNLVYCKSLEAIVQIITFPLTFEYQADLGHDYPTIRPTVWCSINKLKNKSDEFLKHHGTNYNDEFVGDMHIQTVEYSDLTVIPIRNMDEITRYTAFSTDNQKPGFCAIECWPDFINSINFILEHNRHYFIHKYQDDNIGYTITRKLRCLHDLQNYVQSCTGEKLELKPEIF